MPLKKQPSHLADIGIDVLTGDGVTSFVAGRDAAWLVALAAQIDEDTARDRRRSEKAYEKLYAAVTELSSSGPQKLDAS